MGLVNCVRCEKQFYKDNRHINENLKFGHKSYCSLLCQSLTKNKQVSLHCDNPICKNEFQRIPSQISYRNFCSRACAGKIIGPLNGLKHKIFRYCNYCGNHISSRHLYCSMKCWAKSHKRPKEVLLKELQLLANNLGRTPTRRECKYWSTCIRHFGSWNKALIAAGLTPNRSLNQKMYRRRICKAIDGHVCNSVSESIIDNWFFNNNIPHKKEVLYPVGRHTADWKIEHNVFVEYFGLANDSERYDIEIKRKRSICKEYEIRLIEIYPKDLFPKNRLNNIFPSKS